MMRAMINKETATLEAALIISQQLLFIVCEFSNKMTGSVVEEEEKPMLTQCDSVRVYNWQLGAPQDSLLALSWFTS